MIELINPKLNSDGSEIFCDFPIKSFKKTPAPSPEFDEMNNAIFVNKSNGINKRYHNESAGCIIKLASSSVLKKS